MSDSQKLMQSLLTDAVQAMSAYKVADASNMLKLDAMENPFSWEGKMRDAWLSVLAEAEINRYPSSSADSLRQKITEVMKLPDGLDVMLGNGSDEIIQLLIMALNRPGASVLAVEPSFVMYKVLADTLGMQYRGVRLTADFNLDMSATLAAITAYKPVLIFLAVPNNPTGNCFSEIELRQIIERSSENNGLVVIDEAYIAFTSTNMMHLILEHTNVLVMRTLSKIGLAGLRLGMLIAAPCWIEQFNKIRMPYNINVLTQLSVSFALDHYEVLQRQAAMLIEQRALLMADLEACDGVEVFSSEANFILLRTQKNAIEIFEGLKAEGILIKNLSGAHPLLENCLRVTVSKSDENARFLTVFKALI